jgi:hypothetical protein
MMLIGLLLILMRWLAGSIGIVNLIPPSRFVGKRNEHPRSLDNDSSHHDKDGDRYERFFRRVYLGDSPIIFAPRCASGRSVSMR